MADKEKKKLVQRLRNQYRLSVLNETTFEEKLSILLTPLNLIFLLSASILLIGGFTYMAIAFTPLKEYVIPDFTDYRYRDDANYSRQVVDSLLLANSQKDRYVEDLRIILSGGVIEDPAQDTLEQDTEEEITFVLSPQDSALRARISREDRYDVNMEDEENKPINFKQVFPFKPIDGTISSVFDAKIRHYGVDIIAPQNEVVKAIMDGTVIFASYTIDGGNVIQLQHDYNTVSIYKHNSMLFKKVGDKVKAGSSIAVIGESGDHAEGPHVHFELWQNGIPVDPTAFFVFD